MFLSKKRFPYHRQKHLCVLMQEFTSVVTSVFLENTIAQYKQDGLKNSPLFPVLTCKQPHPASILCSILSNLPGPCLCTLIYYFISAPLCLEGYWKVQI